MKIKKLLCLAAVCVFSFGMTTTVMADTIPASTSVTYDGKTLSNEKTDLTEIIKNVQPGDTASISVDLYNNSLFTLPLLLLGTQYAPLRKEFSNIRKKYTKEKAENMCEYPFLC